MSELKPCPFCGSEQPQDSKDDGNVPYEFGMSRSCNSCSAAVNLGWNTRPIEDALTARIAELEEAQRWVPVSERLPEPYTRVLACIKSGYMEVDYMYSEPIVDVGSADFNSLDNVTHWMPLPTPPEEER